MSILKSHRLEILENENGLGKFMEHEKLAKSHGILWSIVDFFSSENKKFSIGFSCFVEEVYTSYGMC